MKNHKNYMMTINLTKFIQLLTMDKTFHYKAIILKQKLIIFKQKSKI
jgi:hypothetical protein